MTSQRNNFLQLSLALAAILATTLGCRPSTHSGTLGSGGVTVDWNIRTTLTDRNELLFERSGNNLDQQNNLIVSTLLQVVSSPDGELPTSALTAQHFIPLRANDQDMRFSAQMVTHGGNLCYAPAASLTGAIDPVTCKTVDAQTLAMMPLGGAATPPVTATPMPTATPQPPFQSP